MTETPIIGDSSKLPRLAFSCSEENIEAMSPYLVRLYRRISGQALQQYILRNELRFSHFEVDFETPDDNAAIDPQVLHLVLMNGPLVADTIVETDWDAISKKMNALLAVEGVANQLSTFFRCWFGKGYKQAKTWWSLHRYIRGHWVYVEGIARAEVRYMIGIPDHVNLAPFDTEQDAASHLENVEILKNIVQLMTRQIINHGMANWDNDHRQVGTQIDILRKQIDEQLQLEVCQDGKTKPPEGLVLDNHELRFIFNKIMKTVISRVLPALWGSFYQQQGYVWGVEPIAIQITPDAGRLRQKWVGITLDGTEVMNHRFRIIRGANFTGQLQNTISAAQNMVALCRATYQYPCNLPEVGLPIPFVGEFFHTFHSTETCEAVTCQIRASI